MFGSTPFGSSTFGSNTSAFGSAGTSFGSKGFGAGTGTSLFGAKTTASTFGGFGTPTQTGTGLFGTTGTTGMFGATPSAFGTGAKTQSTTGFGGFGASTTGTGLFGGTTTTGSSLFAGTNTFGSAAKPVFGATANPAGSLFGTPASSTTGGLFGSATGTTGSLFNKPAATAGLFGGTTATAGQSTAGTPVKFAPQQSTDTMMKSGISTSISTKHQCITVMKEYEQKSLEELRVEDYQLGRKGPQAAGTTTTAGLFNTAGSSAFGAASTGLTAGFGTSGFGTKTATGLFGQQTGTASLFGAKTTASGLFGNTSTTFSTPSAFSSTSTGLFGAKPAGAFGTATTQAGTTGLFGTPAFGAASTGTSLFGTSTFGQTQPGSLFGATSQPSTGLFGATPAFSTSGTATGLFGGTSAFGQTTQPFGAKSTTGTLGSAFGATATGGLFGAQTKPFGTSAFGTSTSGTGLFGNPAGTSSLFGNTGLNFGAGTTLQSQPLGSTLGAGFGTTGLGATGLGLANAGQTNLAALQQQQLQQQLQQHVFALTSSPFGDSPLFRNLTGRSKTDKTSLATTQPQQRGSNTPSQYKVSPRPSARVKPRAIGKNGFSQARLFDGLDDENDYSNETFVPRRSVKKLVLKNTSQSSRSISSELGNSSNTNRRFSNGQPEGRRRENVAASSERDTMFSTPRANGSLGRDDLDNDSPLVGVRFSTKSTTEENESPVVGVRQSRKETGSDVTAAAEFRAEGPGNQVEDVDDVQGPEPKPTDAPEANGDMVDGGAACKVILTRPDYYCNPSIDELNDMANDDGEVIVLDFVVGRDGFGMVKFFGECNVTGLNLDEIVFFRRREIEVYPDSYRNKPAVGKGLNRRAEVTLYQVWPNDKTRRTPIKSPERLKMVGWLEKLETATARLGATFVDYRADTGTWIFTVDHFTRYGLKEVQIEMEDGSVVRRPPAAALVEDKEKLLEKERFEKEQAIERKLRFAEEMATKRKMLQEKMYDEDSYILGGSQDYNQDDSQMTDISHETFPELQEPLDDEEEEEGEATSPASHHLATAMGVKSHRMQVMKASFFGEESQEVEDDRRRDPRSGNLNVSSVALSNTSVLSSDEFSRKPSYSHRMYSPVTAAAKGVPAVPLSRSIMRSAKERKTGGENFRASSQWYSLPQAVLLPSVVGSPSGSPLKAAGVRTQPAVVPLSHSVTAQKHHMFADAGLTMGRSFRVGWGPAWTLVYGTTDVNVTPVSTAGGRFELARGSPLAQRQSVGKSRALGSFSVTCAKVNPTPPLPSNSGVSQDQLVERLQISLGNCEQSDDDSFPLFCPISGVKALHEYAKAAARSKESLASSLFGESAATFSTVLDLVVALWGNLSDHKDSMETDEVVDIDDYSYGLARKEALSEWLAKTSLDAINQEVEEIKTKDNNHLHIILSLLSGRQISAACQVARANGDSRLAFLLAQASGTRTARQWLLKQLEDWLEHKVDKFISHDRLRIYALLAGDMMWRDIQVCQHLDWKRAFAVHMWYDRPSSGLIPDALQSYENSFKGRTTAGVYAAQPRPSYMDEKSETVEPGEGSSGGVERKPCRDTCYHLIKLFCKGSHRLENTLAPASYTQYQLDVSLSWHLYQILRSVGYRHLSEEHAAFLTTSYAAQLESVGLWQWAVFVLLHIADPVRREQVVRNVLVQYCTLNDDEEYSQRETFLLDDLNVPVNWIHEAKVVRARIEKRAKDEAYHLLKSGHYNLSHEVILDRLASSAIINEEYDSIKELLVEIAPTDRSSQVKDWNTGGKIYLDYIKLCDKVNDIKSGLLAPNVYQLEKMRGKVASLCHRISELPSRTATDKLCQSDMGTMSANFLKIIAKELATQTEPRSDLATRTDVLVHHIEKLPLPEDCCLTELRELTSHYVDELAML